ncbi:Serine/threonine protein kinase [Trema orientale]|uniref:Serine/threonine protein kinase n=1 Tax=Trema orientale TaxID=63057 RepID=A0A2P5ELF5_TREOI|nr:Serine/threonine protein kinase [Trema orientale]
MVNESQGSIRKVSVSSSRVKPAFDLIEVTCGCKSSSSTTCVSRDRIKTFLREKIAKTPGFESWKTFRSKHVDESQGSIKKVSASSSRVKPPCNLEDGNYKESINDPYLPPVMNRYNHDLVQGCNLEDVVKACSESQSVSVNVNKSHLDHLVIPKRVLGDIELTKQGRPTSVAVKFMKDIVSQLAESHASGITHGDLKPQNVSIMKGVRRLYAKLSDMSTNNLLPEMLTSSLAPLCCGNDGPQRSADEDMYSLGCLLFFCITGGEHPIFDGDGQNKVVQNLSLVEDFPEAHHAISLLLSPNLELRPKAFEVLYFPLLWKSKKRLSFLCDTSDLMGNYPHLLNELEAIIDLKVIGANCEGKPVIRWSLTMPEGIINFMHNGNKHGYNYRKVSELLRFIRNMKTHFIELSENVKSLMMGVSQRNDLDGYFTSRFPKLLIEVYKLVLKHCEEEESFERYFKGSV